MWSARFGRSFALILILTVIGGCSSAKTSNKKSIALWHIQTVGEGPAIIQQSIDRFKKDNPDVDVEVVPINNDAYKTKIKVAIGAGNAPCVFPTWGGGPLREYVKAGQVMDMTAYMSKDNYKNRFLDAALTGVTFDNKIFGVPVENV